MSKPRRRNRDPEAVAATVIGGIFLLLGIWIMTRPGGMADGVMVVTFFGAVLVVGLARLRAGQDELPPWAVLFGCVGLTAACLLLLADSFHQSHPWSTSQVVLAVACLAGVALFGVGGIAYAIITIKHRNNHHDR